MKVFTMAVLMAALGAAGAAPVPAGAKDADPLPVGGAWAGKLTQRGGGPTGFECEFKITKRDGEKFEAELREKSDAIELTYLVRGTLVPVDPKNKAKGYTIEFKSHESKDVKNTSEILGVPYTGCGVAASLFAFDKVVTKRRCISAGVPTPDFLVFNSR